MATLAALYTGDGGTAQRRFILDSMVGWKVLKRDSQNHLAQGIAQYDYLETIQAKLGGQARRLLEKFLKKWDPNDDNNSNIRLAEQREEDRQIWRLWYKEIAAYNLGRVNTPNMPNPEPVRPDLYPQDPIEEPPDLKEFMDELKEAFQMASASHILAEMTQNPS